LEGKKKPKYPRPEPRRVKKKKGKSPEDKCAIGKRARRTAFCWKKKGRGGSKPKSRGASQKYREVKERARNVSQVNKSEQYNGLGPREGECKESSLKLDAEQRIRRRIFSMSESARKGGKMRLKNKLLKSSSGVEIVR